MAKNFLEQIRDFILPKPSVLGNMLGRKDTVPNAFIPPPGQPSAVRSIFGLPNDIPHQVPKAQPVSNIPVAKTTPTPTYNMPKIGTQTPSLNLNQPGLSTYRPRTKTVSREAVLGSTAPYEHNIQVPSSQGEGNTRIPGYAAQALMEAFDPIHEATNAATVLHHPYQQTRTEHELKTMNPSYNYGENASFKTVADAVQSNGSIDRGLMRINSDTFNGLMKRHPDWMRKIGVNSWEQMKDPTLNAKVGALVLKDSNYDAENRGTRKNPSYIRWYAAPLDLRNR